MKLPSKKYKLVLDTAIEAYQRQDGELFLSTFANDAAWRMEQLRPEHQVFYQSMPQVTRVRQYDTVTLANLTWTMNDKTLQRIAFFQRENDRIRQYPTASDYWGESYTQSYEWGALTYYEVDEMWVNVISAFISQQIAEYCPVSCPPDRLPLDVWLTDRYHPPLATNELMILSPRLLALDDQGEPAPLFWQQLDEQLADILTPAVLRFAIPPDLQQVVDYERAAQAFMSVYQDISVELIVVEEVNAAVIERLNLDGAAFSPTEELLSTGLVHNLTLFATNDPAFRTVDFYDQIWQGAWWQNQMWLIPQAARMNLIYYDTSAYQDADQLEPSLRWTWNEMSNDMRSVPDEADGFTLGLLDVGRDTLFSYAYTWQNDCPLETVRCQRPLTDEAITAALRWYGERVGQEIPDLTVLSVAERERVMMNYQSAQRQAVLWVASPVLLEHYMQLGGVGVVPFPSSNESDGITPLWIEGSFMTQQTERPYAMWQWLRFLSHQPPRANHRLVPARPSIAVRMRYWYTLPLPLGNALRTTFPFARPVLIAEQDVFSWEQLTAVAAGDLSPAEATTQKRSQIVWFRQN